MARFAADNPYHTVAPDDFAIPADFLDRCANFHDQTLLIPANRSTQHAGAAVALEIRLLHETVILMRHEVGLNLSHEVHDHHHDDQQGSAGQ